MLPARAASQPPLSPPSLSPSPPQSPVSLSADAARVPGSTRYLSIGHRIADQQGTPFIASHTSTNRYLSTASHGTKAGVLPRALASPGSSIRDVSTAQGVAGA
eukprot:1688581-Rhodomonas_salina.2